MSKLLSIVNQIMLALLMLLLVFTVTLATVMILSYVLSTNFCNIFVNLTILINFALTQILIPPLLLVKRFLFDVGFNCITMILISFMINVPKNLGLCFSINGIVSGGYGFQLFIFVSVTSYSILQSLFLLKQGL